MEEEYHSSSDSDYEPDEQESDSGSSDDEFVAIAEEIAEEIKTLTEDDIALEVRKILSEKNINADDDAIEILISYLKTARESKSGSLLGSSSDSS